MTMLKRSRFLLAGARAMNAFRATLPPVALILKWTLRSRETSTFTFRLEKNNRRYLIHTVSIVSGKSYAQVEKMFEEAENDAELRTEVLEKIRRSAVRYKKDLRADFGSRVAWYALIRLLRPAVVIENGVEMGYTAVLLCAAVRKNIGEGFAGHYYGLDINPEAGYLVADSKYDSYRTILAGDAIATLRSFRENVGLYFSDGVRTSEYERLEFAALQPLLDKKGIVITNKLAMSPALSELAEHTGAHLISYREQPEEHWYPGSLFGIFYRKDD